jgi:hypothetical protein
MPGPIAPRPIARPAARAFIPKTSIYTPFWIAVS